MVNADLLKATWIATRDRLVARGLLRDAGASLSLRCPGSAMMWLGKAEDAEPERVVWRSTVTNTAAAIHAAVYSRRGDVGAIACGGGSFGACLADFGGIMPQVFDEQARHLGPMAMAAENVAGLEAGLGTGGNAVLWRGMPLCLGTTATRLALNAELFEKCAKAYVLAAATGGRIKKLPWLVRYIANSRLYKDERRARGAFGRGELPLESSGY